VKAIAVLLVGVMLGALVACGGGPPVPDHRADKRSEILALWTQIRDWRREAKMELDPSPQTMDQMEHRSPKEAERVCPDGHKVPPSCNDVCSLSDAICDNAENICNIADELKGDDWAQGKCTSAKASCREAKQKCCNCSAKDPESAGAVL